LRLYQIDVRFRPAALRVRRARGYLVSGFVNNLQFAALKPKGNTEGRREDCTTADAQQPSSL